VWIGAVSGALYPRATDDSARDRVPEGHRPATLIFRADEEHRMPITRLQVETWTRDEDGAGTNGRIRCTIHFRHHPPLVQFLDVPGVNNFRRNAKEVFPVTVDPLHAPLDAGEIAALELENLDADRLWLLAALGLRVNDAIALSRWTWSSLPGDQVHLPLLWNGTLEGLELIVGTADVSRADSSDSAFCTIKLLDGRHIVTHLRLVSPSSGGFQRGSDRRCLIPLPPELAGTVAPAHVDEVEIRKTGSNGWLLRSVRLMANGGELFSNANVSQFLDNSNAVLRIAQWSSKRVVGPVLGGAGEDFVSAQFRVEQPGQYTLRARDRDTGAVAEGTGMLAPAAALRVDGLSAARAYDLSLHRADGSLVAGTSTTAATCPPPPEGARFAFAFGSCCRNLYDPIQAGWASIARLAFDVDRDSLPAARGAHPPLRFFMHLGDTFYFYDADVLSEDSSGDLTAFGNARSAAHAAHLASRLNPHFLDMARRLPVLAVWDDHDFRGNNGDREDFDDAPAIRDVFLDYWPNPALGAAWRNFGLTTRQTYGRTDVYLMDGRFRRIKEGRDRALFTLAQCEFVLNDIAERSRRLGGRLVILASGSPWNGMDTRPNEALVQYPAERARLFDGLRALMDRDLIQGLAFLSGDVHCHEVYEVQLGHGRVAPELVCSAISAPHTDKESRPIEGERRFSRGVVADDGLYAGFATVAIDTIDEPPRRNWTLTVTFRRSDNGAIFFTHRYRLTNNEFRF
jgi:hypothetical protein